MPELSTACVVSSLSQEDHLLVVFGFLDSRMLSCALQLCRRWNKVGSEDVLWRALLCKQMGESNLPRAPARRGGWLQRFWQWHRLDSCTCTPGRVPGREPAPTARFLHRAACLDSGRWLYVFGGRGVAREYNDLWIMDKQHASAEQQLDAERPATWRHVETEEAPPQRQSPTLTAISPSHLLLFGGRQGDTTFLNDTWVFDIASRTWTCVRATDEAYFGQFFHNPCRPAPRWAHTAVAFGGSVLLFGGSAPGTCFADLHWFDMTKMAWRRQLVASGPSPPARSGHCACALGKRSMFVFGGNTTQRSFNDLWEFDVVASTWTKVRIVALATGCFSLSNYRLLLENAGTCLGHLALWSRRPHVDCVRLAAAATWRP